MHFRLLSPYSCVRSTILQLLLHLKSVIDSSMSTSQQGYVCRLVAGKTGSLLSLDVAVRGGGTKTNNQELVSCCVKGPLSLSHFE